MSNNFNVNKNVTIKNQEMIPISVKERIPVIDVLRGVAILCILLLNMQSFSFPDNFHTQYITVFNGMGDQIIYWFIQFFGQGKFYSMLSFLFGLGMAVQVSRAYDTGKKFSWLYSRRLLVLLAIALFHDLALWGGIILLIYSVMGCFLLFFKKRHPKTLLIWAVIFILTPIVTGIFFPHQKPITTDVNQNQLNEREMKKVNDAIEIYQNGSYWDMFHLRVEKLKKTALLIARSGWGILGLFLLGIWTWQKGIFQNIEKNLKFLKRIQWIALSLGLGGTLIFFLLSKIIKSNQPLFIKIIRDFVHTLGTSGLSFFYITSIILLLRKDTWKKFLNPLKSVGRMALSNYFLQTLICTTLFYSYGFKLFGKIGPLIGFLLVFPISAIQIFLCTWWAKHFRFGPIEWLWRSLTYGKRQKIALNEK